MTGELSLDSVLRNLTGAHPMTSLTALTAFRLRLSQTLDVLERDLVDRSLKTGATWEELGEALGVSKSAANRRYGHLTPPRRRGSARSQEG